jgi:DNA repair exonuclease SbcCD ATPase subunit
MSSSILIKQLIVVGIRKNYTVTFNAGVNIIYGDSATGKSSILDLIDYLMGAKKFDLYPEIISAAKYAVLDVELNEVRYSIKRDIFDYSKPIEVYPCSFSEIDGYAAKKYLPNFSSNSKYADMDYFSNFMLEALNLTKIKIKEAPTKDDSNMVRLSFRDIFKFCYVNQDDLGSKKYFKSDNYSLNIKRIEVFKYLFNALDDQISKLEQDISDKISNKTSIEKKFELVSEFLRESEFGSMTNLDSEVTKTDENIESIRQQVVQLNSKITGDSEVYRAIKSTINEIQLEKKSILLQLSEAESNIDRFTRLHNEYLNDISKFNSSLEARSKIGEIQEDVVLCPVCDGDLYVDQAKKAFEIAPSERIKNEINSLKIRVRDTEQLIVESKKKWEIDSEKLKNCEEDEARARDLLDKNTSELISPYLAERDMYVSQLGELNQKRIELVSRLKVRNQHKHLSKQIESIELSVSKLKEKLDKLKEEAPSLTDVLSNLSGSLARYLKFVKIKDPSGIGINEKNITPVLRESEYEAIRSGGVRTIVCIGYLCSLVEEALTTEMSYPSFLMIDTVGKYLGKTKAQTQYKEDTSLNEDNKEGVADPQKYQNVFDYIINLSDQYERNGRTCQFILVDNDVPDQIVDNLTGFIVAHFSSERINGLPVGFIDDAAT